MKNIKYKILVLSDLKEATNEILKSTASLASIMDAEISVFHVKKPTDIVERESQLSAFRTINEKHILTKKQIEQFTTYFKETYNISMSHSYTFGNVKNEIKDYLSKSKPDIIVLGKRKSKTVSLVGDNITDFVLKNYKGPVLIAGSENKLEPNQELSLGVLNADNPLKALNFSEKLLKHSKKPLKSYKFINKVNTLTDNESSDIKTVEYVFERNDDTIRNLSGYISKGGINLLLIDRSSKNKEGFDKSDLKNVMNQLNVSLLISNENNFSQTNKNSKTL